MIITPLSLDNQSMVVAYLRRSPYRNSLPLSNVTQLRSNCDVLVAEEGGRVVGVASTYRSLPIANLTFVAERNDEAVERLLRQLAERNPWLSEGPAYALLPLDRYRQLARYIEILDAEIEYQMVVEPETLHMPTDKQVRRLTSDNLVEMETLAQAAGLTVWHNNALELGPAFGCFVNERLVAMAATHFATTDVVEIGHIATHPDYRRQGFASACTAALTQAAFTLSPRVFLMVLEKNIPALQAYKQLGFQPMERFYLTRFTIRQPDT